MKFEIEIQAKAKDPCRHKNHKLRPWETTNVGCLMSLLKSGMIPPRIFPHA